MPFREREIEEKIFGKLELRKNANEDDHVTRLTKKLEQEEYKNDPVINVIREKFAPVRKKMELAKKIENGWNKREEISLCNDITERLEESLNKRLEKLTKKVEK